MTDQSNSVPVGAAFAPLTRKQRDDIMFSLKKLYTDKIVKWERLGEDERVTDLKASAFECEALLSGILDGMLATQPAVEVSEPSAVAAEGGEAVAWQFQWNDRPGLWFSLESSGYTMEALRTSPQVTIRPLYAHPPAAPQAAEWEDGTKRDAERYRWLRDRSEPPHNFYISVPVEFHEARYQPHEVDAYIDAAIAAARGTK